MVSVRRYALICPILFFSLLLLFLSPLAAQTEEPPPTQIPTSVPSSDTEALLERAEQAVTRAQQAADDARNATDISLRILDFIQAVSVIAPVLVVIAVFFGYTRIVQRLAHAEQAAEQQTQLAEEMQSLRQTIRQTLNTVETKTRELSNLDGEMKEALTSLRGDIQGAIRALSLLPLAEQQFMMSDIKGAIQTYGRARDLASDNPLVLYRFGYVLIEHGELEAARTHLEQALQYDPEFAPAQAALGYVLRRRAEAESLADIERNKLYSEAEGRLLSALHIAPNLVDENRESWWGALGSLYKQRKLVDQAISAYQRASEVTPYSSYPFTNLALLHVEKGDFEKSQHLFARVERLAVNETMTQSENYFAHADLLTARLALNKQEAIHALTDMVIELAPSESPYIIDSLLATLRKLQKVDDETIRLNISHVVEKISMARGLPTEN